MRASPVFVLLATAALGAAPAAAQDTDASFRWAGTLKPGQTLEVRGINGHILATGGSDAEVRATKHGRRSPVESVTIKVLEHADGVTICAIYPSRREPATCEAGRVTGQVENNDVAVDFTVRVPAGVRLVAATVNGEVDARDLGGDADARTVNGDVQVSTRGVASAQTVNGSVRLTLGRADWDGRLEARTVNGSVQVNLPATLDADVRAETMNGELETDFPLTVRGRWGPRKLQGTVGKGGRTLALATVNGSIGLHQR